ENAHEPPPPPAPAVAPRVSKGVLQGDAIVKAQPIYPSIAKQINAAGEVQVAIVIGESGRGVEAEAGKGHPGARRAAEDAGGEMGLQADAPRREAGEAAGHSDICFHPSAMRLAKIVAAGSKGKKGVENKEWGVGTRKLLSRPHSPLSTPHFLLVLFALIASAL